MITATRNPHRFLCFGAGAIGTYIGGSLLLAGHQVVFLEHLEVARTLRQRGLRLQLEGKELRVRQPVVAHTIDEALTGGPFDAAILAIKTFDTPDLLASLKPYTAALPPLLCLQNGVESEDLIAKQLGKARVIAGTVTSAIARRDAGDIVLQRRRGMGVAGGNTLAPVLVNAFNQAGLNCRLFEHAAGMKWSKMFTNLLANASSAILDMTPAQIYAHPGLYEMEVCQLRETLAVMRALHIPLVDLPRTPVRVLGFVVRHLPPSVSRPLLLRAIGSGRGEKMPSFHIDLHGGRGRSEVDYLNGAVVRFGLHVGVATPVNQILNQTLLAMTEGSLAVDSFTRQPEKLLALLELPLRTSRLQS